MTSPKNIRVKKVTSSHGEVPKIEFLMKSGRWIKRNAVSAEIKIGGPRVANIINLNTLEGAADKKYFLEEIYKNFSKDIEGEDDSSETVENAAPQKRKNEAN